MRKISIDRLPELLGAIASERALYLPVDTKGGAKFQRFEDGVIPSDALNTVRSPKDFFFPQTENLMDFKVEGKKIDIIDTREECEDFVIFGVRACDVRSFDVLDRVFLADPVDSYYKNRRDHGVIMSLACTKPHETCFCRTFGIDAAEPAGDIACYKTADALYMNALTERGTALLDAVAALTEECDASAVDAEKKTIRERLDRLPLKDLSADTFGDGKTSKFFNAPEWSELSESCLGCGTCTFASATTSRISTPDTASSDSDAGTHVCTPTSRRCRQVSRDSLSLRDSVSASCTSSSTIRRTTTVCSRA